MMSKKEWWVDFFPDFRPAFENIAPNVTNAQADYVVKKLGLKRGSKFLDCPSGIGRISIPLAKKGIKVTGVDITAPYLSELAEKSRKMRLGIKLVKSDMRRIHFEKEFDAAGNLGTSLGYFRKESDDLLVMKKIFRALKPGGRFMLHIINRDWVMRHYTLDSWFEVGGVKILDRRHFDFRRSVNIAEYHFLKDGRETVRQVELRLYSFHELVSMMRRAGFVDIEGFGSTKDEPISLLRMHMFIIGLRPAK
jgi:ubiquinone/menaquinone biosynthesis C-methylase UbiE